MRPVHVVQCTHMRPVHVHARSRAAHEREQPDRRLVLLTLLHVLANIMAVRQLRLRTVNEPRFRVLLDRFLRNLPLDVAAVGRGDGFGVDRGVGLDVGLDVGRVVGFGTGRGVGADVQPPCTRPQESVMHSVPENAP